MPCCLGVLSSSLIADQHLANTRPSHQELVIFALVITCLFMFPYLGRHPPTDGGGLCSCMNGGLFRAIFPASAAVCDRAAAAMNLRFPIKVNPADLMVFIGQLSLVLPLLVLSCLCAELARSNYATIMTFV